MSFVPVNHAATIYDEWTLLEARPSGVAIGLYVNIYSTTEYRPLHLVYSSKHSCIVEGMCRIMVPSGAAFYSRALVE